MALGHITFTTFRIMAFRDSLVVLDLSHNKLSQLPDEISCLSRLEELNLRQVLTAMFLGYLLKFFSNKNSLPTVPMHSLRFP